MRSLSRIVLLLSIFVVTGLLSSFHRKPKKVIFFGDSITEQGARPGGYIVKMTDALAQKNLSGDYSLAGAGVHVTLGEGEKKRQDLAIR